MSETEIQARGEGHRERLRERFIRGGIERFTDEEVIEFLLTLGTPERMLNFRQGRHSGSMAPFQGYYLPPWMSLKK
jgi:hypothetical protein